MEGLTITIKIGEKEYPGRLPLMPHRFRLIETMTRVMYVEVKADAAAADAADRVKLENRSDVNADDLAAACAACLGLAWRGPDIPIAYVIDHDDRVEDLVGHLPFDAGRIFRACRRDVLEFGDRVIDAFEAAGYSGNDAFKGGHGVWRSVQDSIPSIEEVAEEREDFPDPAADSTSPTA